MHFECLGVYKWFCGFLWPKLAGNDVHLQSCFSISSDLFGLNEVGKNVAELGNDPWSIIRGKLRTFRSVHKLFPKHQFRNAKCYDHCFRTEASNLVLHFFPEFSKSSNCYIKTSFLTFANFYKKHQFNIEFPGAEFKIYC